LIAQALPLLAQRARKNWGSNIDSEVQRGMQTGGPATAFGLGMREAVVSPVSQVIGSVQDAGKAIKNAAAPVMEAGRAFTTGDATPAAAAATPAIAKPYTPFEENYPGNKPIAADQPQQAAQPQAAPGPVARASIAAPLPDSPAAVDSSADVLKMQNDGTWSGMINARTLAKRVDADRQAQIAAAGAEIGRYGASTQRIGAETQAMTGQATAEREHALAQGVGFENQNKATMADLVKELKTSTDPEKQRQLRDNILVMHGRDPRENAFKIAQYEDAIDPQNPLAGTRKIPVMVNAQGQTTYLQPPNGQQGQQGQHEEGKTYVDAKGNKAVYRNGKFEPAK
jgi:hypothetical protein